MMRKPGEVVIDIDGVVAEPVSGSDENVSNMRVPEDRINIGDGIDENIGGTDRPDEHVGSISVINEGFSNIYHPKDVSICIPDEDSKYTSGPDEGVSNLEDLHGGIMLDETAEEAINMTYAIGGSSNTVVPYSSNSSCTGREVRTNNMGNSNEYSKAAPDEGFSDLGVTEEGSTKNRDSDKGGKAQDMVKQFEGTHIKGDREQGAINKSEPEEGITNVDSQSETGDNSDKSFSSLNGSLASVGNVECSDENGSNVENFTGNTGRFDDSKNDNDVSIGNTSGYDDKDKDTDESFSIIVGGSNGGGTVRQDEGMQGWPVEGSNDVPRGPVEDINDLPREPVGETNDLPGRSVEDSNDVPRGPVEDSNEVPHGPVEDSNEVPHGPVEHSNDVPRGPVEDSNDVPRGPVEDNNDLPRGPVEETNDPPVASVEDSNDVPRGPVEDSNDVPRGLVEDSNDVPRGPVEDSNEVPHGPVEDSNEVPHGPVEDSNDVPRGPVEDSNDVPRGPVEETNDPPVGSVEDSNDVPRGPVEDSNDVPRGPVEDSNEVPHGPVEDSNDVPRGPVEDSNDVHRGPFEDTNDLPRGPVEETNDPPVGSVEDSNDVPRGPVEDSNDVPRGPVKDSNDVPRGPVEDYNDVPRGPAEDSNEVPRGPGEDSNDVPRGPVDGSNEEPPGPVEITNDVPRGPVGDSNEEPRGPVENTNDVPRGPAEDSNEEPRGPVENTNDVPRGPAEDSNEEPRGPDGDNIPNQNTEVDGIRLNDIRRRNIGFGEIVTDAVSTDEYESGSDEADDDDFNFGETFINPLGEENTSPASKFCMLLTIAATLLGIFFVMFTNGINFGSTLPLARLAVLNEVLLREVRDEIFNQSIEKLPQDDPRLLYYLTAKRFLNPPSQKYQNLSDSSEIRLNISNEVMKLLNYKKNGFFVECGVLDGETRSNTLEMEMYYGWRGLLLEPNPWNYEIMKTKHRKAWMANICLSTRPFTHKGVYLVKYNKGKSDNDSTSKDSIFRFHNTVDKEEKFIVQCMPLLTLMKGIAQFNGTVLQLKSGRDTITIIMPVIPNSNTNTSNTNTSNTNTSNTNTSNTNTSNTNTSNTNTSNTNTSNTNTSNSTTTNVTIHISEMFSPKFWNLFSESFFNWNDRPEYFFEIDYLSLDTEGHELEVLQSIEFSMLEIKVISVELLNEETGPEDEKKIKEFLTKQKYTLVSTIMRSNFSRICIFVHENVLKNQSKENAEHVTSQDELSQSGANESRLEL